LERRLMSLKHALLGFINYGPMTGYELKKFFDTSVAHFWNAELSQIYPALKQLEGDGLVEMKVEVQNDRPNRKVYSITEQGRRELLDWLATPAEREQVREPILIKVFFGSSMRKDDLLDVLRRAADEGRLQVTYLEYAHQFVDKFVESLGLQSEVLFWQLTIDCGLKVHKAELEWADDAIRRLEAADDSLFECREHAYDGVIDIRTANEVLDRVKSLMPGALSGPDTYFHPAAGDIKKQSSNRPRARVAAE
jgi:PadR family transcriptional regulator, regulatory protein AphA